MEKIYGMNFGGNNCWVEAEKKYDIRTQLKIFY